MGNPIKQPLLTIVYLIPARIYMDKEDRIQLHQLISESNWLKSTLLAKEKNYTKHKNDS